MTDISALRIFERYRITTGHSLESFFAQLNPRKTKTVPVSEFAANITQYCDAIALPRALELAIIFDAERKSGEISVRDVRKVLRSHSHLVTIQGLLEDGLLFPKTLAARDDFQAYYSEWGAEDGVPALCLVESALRLQGEERKPGDLQIIYKWLKLQKILVHVRQNRLLEVCRSIHLFDCPAGSNVVTQGDEGDAFYIVLQGSLDILINDIIIANIGAGKSFGEKALENNAPRAATVRAVSPCKLLVLMASEYQSLAATAQNKVLQEMVDFLYRHCRVLHSISRAKIFTMVRAVAKQALKQGESAVKQGEVASALYVVMAGAITLYRRIVPPQEPESAVQTSTHHQRVAFISVPVRSSLQPGEVFGDDCLHARGRNVHSYTAIVTSPTATIIMINRKEVAQYFRGPALEALLLAVRNLHSPDDELLSQHVAHTNQQRILADLRETAFGPSYRDKTAFSRLLQSQQSLPPLSLAQHGGGKQQQQSVRCTALPPQSRSLSTAALQAREQQHRTKLAQLEYEQRGVVLSVQKFPGRRDSVMTGAAGALSGRRGSVARRQSVAFSTKPTARVPAV